MAAVLLGMCLAPGAWAQSQSAESAAVTDSASDAGLAGRRPEHLWSMDYVDLVLGDTGSVLTAPARWDFDDWVEAASAVSAVAGTAAFDKTIRAHVQAGRTAGEDKFMKQWQEFGNYYAFGALAAFDAWGEIGGDVTAKNTAMDGIAASIIAGGLITPALKVVVGRERPSTTTSTFRFKPFSTNSSFPSGHATEAFAVAAAIAENYPTPWVECLAYGTAGLVGYARIEQNAHFASDVVAGSLIGWFVGRAVVHRNDGPKDPKKLSWTPYATPNGVGVVFHKAF
jgi:membrane-associated phospholipid phosphatase